MPKGGVGDPVYRYFGFAACLLLRLGEQEAYREVGYACVDVGVETRQVGN